MKKVAFLDTVHPVLEDGLSALGWECLDWTTKSSEEILNQPKNGINGFIIRSRIPVDQPFLALWPDLEFIGRSGAGMENIDVEYCLHRSLALFNAPEGNRNAVAEHALGMLLSLFNKLNKGDAEVRSGMWNREENRGVELDGKKVGLIGFGNNGSAFARKLRGFDVEIFAYDKYKTGFGDQFVNEVSLDVVLAESDVISFHIPQNEETIFWMNDEFVAAVTKPFYLINLSRGKIVKTSSLVNGIKSGKILGACLDVLEYEKSSFEKIFSSTKDIPQDFKFLVESEKVILSPHVGGWTVESYYKLSEVLLTKIKAHYLL